MFLTPDEVATLTGIKKGRDGETREQLQVKQLRLMGVAFRINARSRPIVTWAAVDGQIPIMPTTPKWAPAVLSLVK